MTHTKATPETGYFDRETARHVTGCCCRWRWYPAPCRFAWSNCPAAT